MCQFKLNFNEKKYRKPKVVGNWNQFWEVFLSDYWFNHVESILWHGKGTFSINCGGFIIQIYQTELVKRKKLQDKFPIPNRLKLFISKNSATSFAIHQKSIATHSHSPPEKRITNWLTLTYINLNRLWTNLWVMKTENYSL